MGAARAAAHLEVSRVELAGRGKLVERELEARSVRGALRIHAAVPSGRGVTGVRCAAGARTGAAATRTGLVQRTGRWLPWAPLCRRMDSRYSRCCASAVGVVPTGRSCRGTRSACSAARLQASAARGPTRTCGCAAVEASRPWAFMAHNHRVAWRAARWLLAANSRLSPHGLG